MKTNLTFFFFFIYCCVYAQNDTTLLLFNPSSKHQSNILEKGDKVKIHSTKDSSAHEGTVTHFGKNSIFLDDKDEIPTREIKSISLKRKGNFFGMLAGSVLIASGVLLSAIDEYYIPASYVLVCSSFLLIKPYSKIYKTPDLKFIPIFPDSSALEKQKLLLHEKNEEFLEKGDTIIFTQLMLNIPKLFDNNVCLSYELRTCHRGNELQIGFIFPQYLHHNFINDNIRSILSVPYKLHYGTCISYDRKYYKSYTSKKDTINRFIALSFQYKKLWCKNKWYEELGYPGLYLIYSANISQLKNNFSFCVKAGGIRKHRNFIFETYYALGLRLSYNKTRYNGFEWILNNPGLDYNSIYMDDGLFVYPFVNLGFKIGFTLQKKAGFRPAFFHRKYPVF
jgi:hypothetical protein